MSNASRSCVAAAIAVALFQSAAPASAGDHGKGRDEDQGNLKLKPLATYDAGGVGSAEIVAFDASSKRLFLVNAATSTVDVLDVRNPSQPKKVTTIDTGTIGSPNSVAVRDGVVAVAIESRPKTDPGHVAFYDANGKLIKAVKVGALPDMITFTPDGSSVLTANEGEPSGYGPGHVDPEGSVSIVPVPRNSKQWKQLSDRDVRTVSFTQFNGKEAKLRAQGIRIYGPGASAAQDLEPEYIAVTEDSRTAYVTLQENNAIAEIDIKSASLTNLLPLGYKDYSEQPFTTATYEWNKLPAIGTTVGGQTLYLGGFSGLAFEGTTGDGKLKFITHTDRGPNGEPTGINRPFLLPEFTPRLVRFTLDPYTGGFQLQQQILLQQANGKPLTGLPNAVLSNDTNQPYNDEIGVDLFGKPTALDPLGADLEGIAIAEDGSFWMCDEYRPSIYHFDSEGRLIERLVPIGTHAAAGKPVPAPGQAGEYGVEALPAVIAQRRQNRGMEGIAIQDGKIYAFVQSPMRNPATLGNAALNAMKNVRVIEYDPETRATRQFLYVMDNPPAVSADDTRADKIGDVAAVPGGFLVVERDDDALPEDPIETITKKIYATRLNGATDISALGLFNVGGVQKSVDQMTEEELATVGVVPMKKTLHVDLASAGYASVEKVEGLAVLDNGQLALINDNDFGVAGIVIDNATGKFSLAPGYTPEKPTLGLLKVPGLDASDRDDAINIRNWPVFGMYQPDAIASFRVDGITYLITANEGDARDWDGFAEEARVGSLALDPVAFPDAAELQKNANLGRLNVTKALGDANGDGLYVSLYTLGGRSFSIWKANGVQVFDSGSDFERIVAASNPAFFNASHEDRTFDSRSDNKGPEPEGLAVGMVGKRRYAFVGLERMGGVITYDITNPHAPFFVDYTNNRDFSVDPYNAPAAGDLGPEGLLFIDAKDSPTRSPLLVIANEISGTVTLYQIERE
ncbi:choice-of-anchor I family protein [Steroidobacter cummioxidans]|uniref:choice-of-anchor I family protein n=1 Tax=Steroidobacter cummioxidans TaxID=1803913 RepID=UPI00137A2DB1|nr:choice-of-anchor I family protein [Steroidobacter cummioxidans]